jgi:esterase/lipase superfamily enzyme
MLTTFSDRLEGGSLQLVCVDSVDSESWYHVAASPYDRVHRHIAYEAYICAEVLPLMRSRLPPGADGRVATFGMSLGGFHATLLALRHPHLVNRLVSVSGTYDNEKFLSGYHDLDTYLTNPLAFVSGMHDASDLDALRSMYIALVTGSADPHVDEARSLSRMLWEKGVPNDLDVWDGWMHDWPYWHDMLKKHL